MPPTTLASVRPYRREFLAAGAALVGSPYLWGGKGRIQWTPTKIVDLPYLAFDCMGFPLGILHQLGVVDLRLKWNTDLAFAELPKVRDLEAMKPGDLLFYGGDPANPADVDHVEVWVGDGRILGARGGGSKTLTIEDALRRGARVDYKPANQAGRPVRGLRSLSPYLAD